MESIVFGTIELGPAGILLGLLMMAVGLLALAFWIWMLVDCVKDSRLDTNEKAIWVVVIALTQVIGALIYFFLGRPRRTHAAQFHL
jgi:heme/copper-type cytochrome/quinol oxidase subunit 4